MADESTANSTPPDSTTAPPTVAPPAGDANTSANVSTSAPDSPQPTATPATATIAAAPAPADPAAAAEQPPQDPLAKKIFHGIMGALGGTQDISYQRDPQTGKLVVSTAASGTGTQWKRIIAGAVQGTAAGLGAAPGPGQMARAASAGFGASAGTAPAQEDQKRQQADTDFNEQQKAMVSKAQTQLLTTQNSAASFNLTRMGVDAHAQDAQRENDFAKLIRDGGNGSQDLGTASNFSDVLAMHKDMPTLYKELAQGNIVATPHVDAEGKFAGMRYALVTPQWKDAKLTTDQNFYHLVPASKPGEQPQIEKQTVRAGTMSNGDFTNAQSSASAEILKWQTENHKEQHQDTVDKSTVNKNNAEAVQARAAANKDNAQASALRNPDGMGDDAIVDGMLDGSIDITKTASIRGNRREQLIAQAKTKDPNFNMQDYGIKLATRKDFTGDGKASQSIQSFNTFLGHADDLSMGVNALRNSHSPLINKPINWLKKNASGNPAVTGFLTQIDAAKTEFQNFLNNNHALMAQDKEEGQKLLNENMSPAQLQGQMKQFVATAAIRMSAVNHTYYRVFNQDAPDMLDEDGKAALAHFGVPETMVYHHPTGVAAPTNQPAPGPPAAKGGFNWGDHPVAN